VLGVGAVTSVLAGCAGLSGDGSTPTGDGTRTDDSTPTDGPTPTDDPIQDSDGDGVIDSEDYAPRDPDVQEKSDLTSTETGTDPGPSSTDTPERTSTPGGAADAWTETAVTRLAAADGEPDENFGSSVAVFGNLALVGAPGDEAPGDGNDNPSDAPPNGSAYAFSRVDGEWTQQAKLRLDSGNGGRAFGVSVAFDGLTGLVGDPGFDEFNQSAGSVHAFSRVGGEWTRTAELLPDADLQRDPDFGWSVALDGDTAVVGAPDQDNERGSRAGTAYVFSRAGDDWIREAALVANDGDDDDAFGWSVAVEGDTALVGAMRDEHPNGENAGSAYVFSRSNGSWSQQAKLVPDDGDADDEFGRSVALDGDRAVVGASQDEDPNGAGAGSAYVFARTDGGWSRESKLVDPEGIPGAAFGRSVAAAEGTAFVGAYADDRFGETAGSAHAFSRPDGEWGRAARLAPGESDAGDRFGWSIDASGRTAIVGADHDEDPNGDRAGAAYVIEAGANAQ